MNKSVEGIEAIYFDELSELMPEFKVSYATGALKCSCCGEALNKVGIHSVEIQDGVLKWTCQKVDCVLLSAEDSLSEQK